MLEAILGSTITVSTRNGFPRAPKQLRAADDYLFSEQTVSEYEYVSEVIPEYKDKDDNLVVNNVGTRMFIRCFYSL